MAPLILVASEFRSRSNNEPTMPTNIDPRIPNRLVTIAERIIVWLLFEPSVPAAVLQREHHRNRRGIEIVLFEQLLEARNPIRPAVPITIEHDDADLR